MYNAIDTVKNKIIELLEIVAKKMEPAMKRLLIEGAELLHQDSNSVDRLMRYVDQNLETLHDHLNEDNFNRILDIVWDILSQILHELLQSNLDVSQRKIFDTENVIYFLFVCRNEDLHLSLQIFTKL